VPALLGQSLVWQRLGQSSPLQPLLRPKEDGAGLVGLVAHGDHLVERLVDIALER